MVHNRTCTSPAIVSLRNAHINRRAGYFIVFLVPSSQKDSVIGNIRLDLDGLLALPLLDLEQQRAVDVGQDTTKGDGGADEGVEFLVAADSQLQVAGRDALHLEILGRISSQLEHFSSKVFQDGGEVDGGLGSDARALTGDVTKVALYAAAGELQASPLALLFHRAHRDGWKVAAGKLYRDVARHRCGRDFSLTCKPAFAECDLDVFTLESPLPPVLPPVLPVGRGKWTR